MESSDIIDTHDTLTKIGVHGLLVVSENRFFRLPEEVTVKRLDQILLDKVLEAEPDSLLFTGDTSPTGGEVGVYFGRTLGVLLDVAKFVAIG